MAKNDASTQKLASEARQVIYPDAAYSAGKSQLEQMQIDSNIWFLTENAPGTLRGIIELCLADSSAHYIWQESLVRRFSLDANNKRKSKHAYLNEHRISLLAHRFALSISEQEGTKGNKRHEKLLSTAYGAHRALEEYLGNGVLSEEIIESTVMIAYINNLISTRFRGLQPLAPDYMSTAAFISARLPEVRRIFPELIQREACDRETIEMLLGSPADALLEGVL